MAYSPKMGLDYIPSQLVPFGYADDEHFKFVPGRWNLGDVSKALLGPRTPAGLAALKAMSKGELVAWDPVKQTARLRDGIMKAKRQWLPAYVLVCAPE
jgi:quinohemoprotein ethanol dehydrogenase